MYHAVQRKKINVIECLVRNGVKIDSKIYGDGNAVLALAVKYDFETGDKSFAPVLNILQKLGADVCFSSPEGILNVPYNS